MKKTILALVALSALVVLVGCDPFGSEKTMAYITGTIYSDSALTIPAEGLGVELLVNDDSSAVRTQIAFTDISGVFFMEIQFYPFLPDEESGAGYSLPSTAVVGLVAHNGTTAYWYKSEDEGYVLSAGDTLTVHTISLASFAKGSGGAL
ncbi:MAG: hypothetical protein KAR40_09955 [Candidatus Sabulitectum sp.]|nr:hypothetical protein [Candidatus Sabulitectum sp.]